MRGGVRNRHSSGRPAVVAGVTALLAASWSVAAPAAPVPTHAETAPIATSASDPSRPAAPDRVNGTDLTAHAGQNADAPHDQHPASTPSAAQIPIQPIGAGPAAPRNPKVYVTDVEHLAHLVASDPVASPMAQQLVSRRQSAVVTGTIGAVIGGGLIVAGLVDTQRDCLDGSFGCTSHPNFTLFAAGLVILPLAAALAVALLPTKGDQLEVIKAWNPRHLDNQLALEPIRIVNDGPPASMSPPAPPQRSGPQVVVPMTGGPPVTGIPIGGNLYIPVTGGPPIPAIPTSP